MKVVRTSLPPQLSSVPAARRLVRQATSRDPPELADVAELLAAELVSNAVKHARTRLTLQVDHEPSGAVRLRVHDSSSVLPARKDDVLGRADGYGLQFLEALAAEWGTAVEPGDGKTVWCVIRKPSAT